MFEQIWKWVTDNIVPLLTASNIVVFIGFVLALVPKLKKTINKSTDAATTLSGKFAELNGIIDELKSLKTAVESMKESSETNTAVQTELKELLGLTDAKVNAVLDIQETAYGATKLSEVKDTIKNIHANVRFDTTGQRKKLAKDARETAAKIAELASAANKQLIEIEHAAEPKESQHISSITL